MQHVEFKLKTLPGSGIWTGSADHTRMTAIQSTSLMGGMRFWTEAFLRSFGYYICDCTNEKKEIFKADQWNSACPACHIFGCTGLARSFNLHVQTSQTGLQDEGHVTVLYFHADPQQDKRPPCYSLARGFTSQDITLKLSPHRPLSWPRQYWNTEDPVRELAPSLIWSCTLMLEYGALGAKDQYGCGLVTFNNTQNAEQIHSLLTRENLPETAPEKSYASLLPDLKDFFFFKGTLNRNILHAKQDRTFDRAEINHQRIQRVPSQFFDIVILRRILRNALRSQPDTIKDIRHWLCGSLNECGAHLSLGVTTEGQLYGWGWIPRNMNKKEEALNRVRASLAGVCPDLHWKEFNSARDNSSSKKNWQDFLLEMVQKPWREKV